MVEKISPQEMVQKRFTLVVLRGQIGDPRNGEVVYNWDEEEIRQQIKELEEFLRSQIEEHWNGDPINVSQELQDVGDTFHTPFTPLDKWP